MNRLGSSKKGVPAKGSASASKSTRPKPLKVYSIDNQPNTVPVLPVEGNNDIKTSQSKAVKETERKAINDKQQTPLQGAHVSRKLISMGVVRSNSVNRLRVNKSEKKSRRSVSTPRPVTTATKTATATLTPRALSPMYPQGDEILNFNFEDINVEDVNEDDFADDEMKELIIHNKYLLSIAALHLQREKSKRLNEIIDAQMSELRDKRNNAGTELAEHEERLATINKSKKRQKKKKQDPMDRISLKVMSTAEATITSDTIRDESPLSTEQAALTDIVTEIEKVMDDMTKMDKALKKLGDQALINAALKIVPDTI